MSLYSGKDLTSIAEQILASKIEYQKDSFFEALYDFGSSALASALAGTNDKKSKAYNTYSNLTVFHYVVGIYYKLP